MSSLKSPPWQCVTEIHTCNHLQERRVDILKAVRSCEDPCRFINHSSTETFPLIDQQNLKNQNVFLTFTSEHFVFSVSRENCGVILISTLH